MVASTLMSVTAPSLCFCQPFIGPGWNILAISVYVSVIVGSGLEKAATVCIPILVIGSNRWESREVFLRVFPVRLNAWSTEVYALLLPLFDGLTSLNALHRITQGLSSEEGVSRIKLVFQH